MDQQDFLDELENKPSGGVGPTVLDLNFQEEELYLREKDSKEPSKFILREMSGTDRDAYMNYVSSKTSVSKDGETVKVKDYGGLTAFLLNRTLFRADGITPVDVNTIQKWPSRVQSVLADKARAISGLDEKADETAKND
jgi:hypothetical protein